MAVSCNSGSSNPEAVADKALSALQKGDYKAYFNTFDMSKDEVNFAVAMAEDKIVKEIENKGGIKGYTVGNAEVDGDNASVPVVIEYNNGDNEEKDLPFVKKDGKWKQSQQN